VPGGGTTAITLNGAIIPGNDSRPSSYTWYITRLGALTTPAVLETRVYGVDNGDESVLHWTATETGIYTTTGTNQWGEGPHSGGFFVQINAPGDCAITAAPLAADASNFRVSAYGDSPVQNQDGSWSNVCEAYGTTVQLNWNAISGAASYVLHNATTDKDTVITSRSFIVNNVALNGAYTLRGRNIIGDGDPTSEPIVVSLVECPFGKPTFASAPAGNVCPAASVLLDVNNISLSNSGLPKYRLYNGSTLVQETAIVADRMDHGTFTITQSGVYTVKAVSVNNVEGEASDPVTITIGDCGSVNLSSLSDLVGIWSAKDQSGAPAGFSYGWTANNYTVTIAEASGSLTIGGIGNLGQGGATVTATVDFADGTDGVYGTITIPQQNVAEYGGAAVTNTEFSGVNFSMLGSPSSYAGSVTATIKVLAGKPVIVFNGNYAIKAAAELNAYVVGGTRATQAFFEKQQ
jgi:hypothetical protein